MNSESGSPVQNLPYEIKKFLVKVYCFWMRKGREGKMFYVFLRLKVNKINRFFSEKLKCPVSKST